MMSGNNIIRTLILSVHIYGCAIPTSIIYKYSEVRAVAKQLESDFVPKKGYNTENIIGSFDLYNEICDSIALDGELIDMLKSSLNENCYH